MGDVLDMGAINQAKDSEFPVVEPGEYEARVVEVVRKQARSGDSYYLNWKFKLYNEQTHEYKANVWGITSLSPKALWRVKRDFKALLRTDDLPATLDTDDLVGRYCRVVVINEESTKNDNKKRASVSEILPTARSEEEIEKERLLGGSTPKPAIDDGLPF